MGPGETTARTVVMTGALIATLIGVAATAGATVVPQIATPSASPKYQPPQADPAAQPSTGPSTRPSADPTPEPTVTPTSLGPDRPAAVFNTWAVSLSKTLNVPVVALESYAYAEWVLSQTRPTCKLQWTTLAGLGSVASDHGRVGERTVDAEGVPHPVLMGPVLDGLAGRVRVPDSDGGALDGNQTWDLAMGPMQLLPGMWRASGVDGDSDGLANPQDVDDAALAAAYHLCPVAQNASPDLSVVANWKKAVNSYHGMTLNIDKVYDAAQQYGLLSKDQRYPERRR
jgi:membrane-bound lytic murein transglycosylase B